ncbi:MAG TPA: DEAD/DEAH box helicase family protein [Tenuifilaceae bacterium]|jgi:type I restriction enzyme R subunit|nr:DEAD/DEAH box helicase family protein [Bacteroidales bacterium]MDI9516352.1 DEAD/DEAH box helicase family protein [Bacteroidota bacterium]HNV81422.1 DEAD/DEAH box helicase family protein [Tenuifilaceae bacterium]MZP82251.1 DEAD/DEAH box helicase family protein [Bacteroidales bacterium]HOF91304.1 DEAD/DEAH box helicase family protein [Tenuifilaceae bacterium]
MNEAETRAELIDPKLKACGWGVVEGSKVLREYHITQGKIQTGGGRGKKEIADYVLVYKGIKLAIVEAKSDEQEVGEGVMQAKKYAQKLQLETTYSTNGKDIYQICMKTGEEGLVTDFLSPDELWNKTFPKDRHTELVEVWREQFANVPFEDKSGSWQLRYYQEIAVQRTVEAIAQSKDRILLTLATGTGKTAIAFQIAWKLFQTRWNLKRDGSRRPRILFLADRNILADQAYNSFSAFPEDALVRIKPNEIKKSGKVPTNGSIFFTIFQTFMSGTDTEGKPAPYFGEYPKDYFDFIIIDECHRGGANDESNWRGILEYFSPAVQLGLTATPKRKDNVDTYKYFGEPVYIYSLKEGINDGFLTPFKVKRIKTTLDDYRYTSDDTIVEGEIEEGKLYEEKDFNRTIEIVEREAKRVNIFLDEANQNEKAIIFCANQAHAALIRDLVNQNAKSKDPFYCVRVTANDGEEGERLLREFQDNEKTIPTILTTSQKLSTGVDARNIRNIVLLRPVNSMIEFKQIVGRGTRLFDGKEFFTIYDFVDAYKHFSDPEWDGEPLEEEPCKVCGQNPCECEYVPPKPCPVCGERPCICEKQPPQPCEKCGQRPCVCKKKVKIKLKNGKEREIKHMISTSFWSADGKPISAEEFLNNLFGELPKLFKDEEELRKLWSNPLTRKILLENLDAAGFPKGDLLTLQKLVDMEKSDLYDVLEYVFNGDYIAMTREARAKAAEATIFALLNDKQKEFISFVLSKYIETGVDELDQEKLPILLTNKYQSLEDAKEILGDVANISRLFIEFQEHLYKQKVA